MQLQNDKITTLQTGIQTAYLDHTINSNLAYRPEFISNNYKLGKKVLVSIEEELQRCEEFFISVAFMRIPVNRCAQSRISGAPILK